MNDEIKEILYVLKHIVIGRASRLTCKEADKLLDYITNLQQERDTYYSIVSQKLTKEIDYQRLNELQQENERLKEQLEYLRSGEYLNQVKWERDLNENLNQTLGIELEDYKSRCEKAIKYNYELQERYCHSAIRDELIASKIYEITERELNILQNGSDGQ